ncbi:MAG: sulfite exporter TauE/SafE family protein [Candidatus Promineifilaceae bacterium]
MSEYSIEIYLVVALGILFIGMSKGGLGASLGALAVTLTALVLPIKDVVGFMLPILMLADILAVGAHWKKWNGRLLVWLIPASLVGVTLGTLLLANAPSDLIRILLGIIVLLLALYKLFQKSISKRLTYTPRNWHGLIAGSVAGFTSSVAHTGGPPIDSFLLMQNLQPRTFAATAAIFFFILNYIKVPFYFAADVFNFDLLRQFVGLLLIVPLGVWAGRWLVVRVSKKVYDNIILAFLFIAALLLIFT